MTKILFLDESGDHNLTKIDQTHPIFVLGGVIADKKYAEGEMSEKVFNFKKEKIAYLPMQRQRRNWTIGETESRS